MDSQKTILTPSKSDADTASSQPVPAAKPLQTDLYKETLQHLPIQRKLSIGTVDDPMEHEADTMADKVMRMPETNFVQRKCSHCDEEEQVQMKPIASSVTPFIQTKGTGGGIASDTLTNQINATRGSGSSMDGHTQSFMENRFGTDFSNVKIHTSDDAVQMSRELNAQAFTAGSDIYFNSGKYNPSSDSGKHLLAHELTHTVQQGGARGKAVQLKTDEAATETEFNKWADTNKRVKDKTNKDFPWSAWDFIRPQIVDDTMELLPKPKDKTGIEKWNDNFTKAEIIGNWIARLRTATSDDTVKKDAESKIYYIADSLAKAGFISKAMSQAANTGNSEKALIFTTVLANPAAASPAELETIFNFQAAGKSDPADVDFIKTLSQPGGGNTLQKLDAARTQAMFRVMITRYPLHSKIVEAMAATLIFNTAVRTTIADGMLNSSLGSPELLFKILSHPYFKDPDYEGALLINTPNNDIDKDAAKHWKDDMPFAVKYKQQYYTKFLINLAAKQSITIAVPANFSIATLRTWLDANTENIAQAAAKEYPANNNAIFDIYRNITDIFFYHVDHDKNAIPDEEGKLAKLGVAGKPDKTRIEADCDVFATYAMRLFNTAGFEPVGYLGLYPTGTFTGRAAHAAALIRKGGSYFIINNKNMFDSGIAEKTKDEKKEDAVKEMKKKAIEDAYGDPRPTTWELYYADSEAKGKLPGDFLAKPAKYLRTNL